MANPVRVLFAGESWMTHSVHTKGFDSFDMSSYHEGGTEMIAALRAGGVEVAYQPSHIAMEAFPGIPSVSSGMNEPVAALLFADSGAATPSIAPLPKRSGCLLSFFSSA